MSGAVETQPTPCMTDSWSVEIDVPAATAFDPIRRIGGDTGWYYANWLWRLRGWFDRLAGGIGFRRGRRHPDELAVGDAVDFMRVEAFEPGRRLLLAFEMKVPGRAWLEFEVVPNHTGSTVRQTAIYSPHGLLGRAYWYLVYPFHQLVFAGMLRGIAAKSGARQVRWPGAQQRP